MKKNIVVLVLLFVIRGAAQDYGFGTLLDSSLYANSPTAAPLMRGDYDNLPASASLKEFTPTPGNQGPTSTCAAWSTAYAGRTILEALKNGWSKATIDSNAFSPSFVYNQIRANKSCNAGTSLIDALDVLKNQGGIKMKDFSFECSREVTETDKVNAIGYRIIEYRDITYGQKENKIKVIKKSLSQMRPVIIAFDCPPSFNTAMEVLKVDSSEYKYWGRGHGIAVIGFDDKKFGGAFELINSWGTNWGKNGYVWIKYSDFYFFCQYAFELIDKTSPDPNKPDLSGTLTFRENTGADMNSKFVNGYFSMDKPYPAGTLFELRIANNEPAYVYSFSSDLTYKTYKIFPFNSRMVAYLPYSQNNLAIPDEDSYNMLDENAGTSYYCFLYSKEKLDIDSIMTAVEKAKGSFTDRVFFVLRDKLVSKENIDYKGSYKISFNAKSRGKSVVPVIVEINHVR